jgi:hypothetical protein
VTGMDDDSDSKSELEKAVQDFLEQENRKTASLNGKKHLKKGKPAEENIFYTNYPSGIESS